MTTRRRRARFWLGWLTAIAGAAAFWLLVFWSVSEAACAPGGVCGPRDSLSWELPTTNTDGTPFTDFASHEVVYTAGTFIADPCTPTTSSTAKNLGPLTTPTIPTAGLRANALLSLLGLPQGLVSTTVRVVDLGGTKSGCPTPVSFTYDSVPPDTTITGRPLATSTSTLVSFLFTASEAGSTFECKVDGAAFAPCASPYPLTVTDGPHTFQVRAIDAVGNVDPSPATYTWTTLTVTINVPTTPSGLSVGPTP